MTEPMPDNSTPAELVAGLVDLLTVTREGDDSFVGQPQPGGVGRVFGGQVIAQALQAAQATAPEGMAAHSLHAYFLRGGEEGVDIDYQTARDFDGRSFANRRVVARQQGRPILNLTASFQQAEDGLSHDDYTMPQVTPPEELTPDTELRRQFVAQLDHVSDLQRALMLRPRPADAAAPVRPT